MEKPNKLADLKLVNKYYPATGVANYSYPSPKMDSTTQCGSITGRSSIGSQASVPEMVEDQESDMSIDGDNRSSYHTCCAELWDSFWEDPFWEANAEEASREADGVTRTILNKHCSYPALLPSPDEKHSKDQYFRQSENDGDDEPTTTWPRAHDELSETRRPTTPKAGYSLFPRPLPAPVLNISPRKLSVPPRTTSLGQSPRHTKSTISLSTLAKTSSKANRTHVSDLEVNTFYSRSSWTHSAPPTPRIPDRPSSAAEPLARRASNQSLIQKFTFKIPRTRSDTVMSRSSVASARTPSIVIAPQKSMSLPPPRVQSRSPERTYERYSQPEVRRAQSHMQLQRCMTDINLSSYHSQPRVPTRIYSETSPPSPALPPMPVSVFELDSEDEDEEEDTSFARRLARSFAPSKRTRSASATTRSRKGLEIAMGQLRRARAAGDAAVAVPAVPCGTADEIKDERGAAPPVLRRQKSEVFGKIFWGRR